MPSRGIYSSSFGLNILIPGIYQSISGLVAAPQFIYCLKSFHSLRVLSLGWKPQCIALAVNKKSLQWLEKASLKTAQRFLL